MLFVGVQLELALESEPLFEQRGRLVFQPSNPGLARREAALQRGDFVRQRIVDAMSAPAVRNDRDSLGLEISNFGAQVLLPHQGSVPLGKGPVSLRNGRIPFGAAERFRKAPPLE